ncbi:rh5-interacting protein-like isoform X4 [Leptidea sinapis]|uniref:rh5-interacting protein-like isoform X4 n=1 Tax=Leptidea sinapis TaxID=189913 RepID=UPI0021C3E5EA|nr:rh5-interacting protein-like isoform X4 [Leptidea sinapis]
MDCNMKTTINMKCKRPGCFCFPTNGKPHIYICTDIKNNIISCGCEQGTEWIKTKCIKIKTNGANCICVCNVDNKIQTCNDCECVVTEKDSGAAKDGFKKCDVCTCIPNKPEDEVKCSNKECTCILTKGKPFVFVCHDDTGKIVSCDENKNNCVCLPTDGNTCICVCEDAKDGLKKCDDCTCIPNKSEDEVKCSNKECTCILTKGKPFVFVCHDDTGKIVSCDENKNNCVCLPTDGNTCICVCEDAKDGLKKCDDCTCIPNKSEDEVKCSNKECTCILTKGKPFVFVCHDDTGKIVSCDENKNNCVCLPTDGNTCICVCEDAKDGLKKCDDVHAFLINRKMKLNVLTRNVLVY